MSAAAAAAPRTAVVVGASRGLGLEFVRQLAARGDRVVAGCRDPEAARPALEAIGVDVVAARVDVGDEASIDAFAAEAARLAGGHVDLLICSAGVYGLRVDLGAVAQADMLETFRVNAAGPILVAQALRRAGALGGARPSLGANLSSKVGSVGDNASGGRYGYRASKAALNVTTKSLAVDLAAENVVATLLHPGYVRTDMTGGAGLISSATSVAGMLAVLSRGDETLRGAWHDYKSEVVPW
jgi:NAD(P)-dependent dehydrogenase (short-subunit alcohol dehydrogenase family)